MRLVIINNFRNFCSFRALAYIIFDKLWSAFLVVWNDTSQQQACCEDGVNCCIYA